METFNILNNTVSFDSELSKVSDIYIQSYKTIELFKSVYNAMKYEQLKDYDEFVKYVQKMEAFMFNEFESISSKVLDMLVQYQIYDKTTNDIKAKCKTISYFSSYMRDLVRNANNFSSDMLSKLNDIHYQSNKKAINAVQPNYLNIWSNSGWSLFVADVMNITEQWKTDRKQELIYKANVKAGEKKLQPIMNKFIEKTQIDVQTNLYTFGILAIKEMYDIGIDILIEENKISNAVQEHLQKEKCSNILSNLDRIQDENIKKQQVLVALQLYPFTETIHSKILDFEIDNIKEYTRLIKFIKCENMVLNACVIKHTNISNNEKYENILKQLDDNGNYYQMYLDKIRNQNENIGNTENTAKNNASNTKDNSNNLFNTKLYESEDSKKQISYNLDYTSIFDIFYVSASSLGKIETQDKANGHIVAKTNMNVAKMISFATIDITIKKITDNETIVNINVLTPNNNTPMKSGPKWLQLLLNEVNKRLNPSNNSNVQTNNVNTQNHNTSQVNQTNQINYEYDTKKAIRKSALNIYLVVIAFFTIMFTISVGFGPAIAMDLVFSIILYPVIYFIVYMYHKSK